MKACLSTTLMFSLENNSANLMHNQQNEKSTQVNSESSFFLTDDTLTTVSQKFHCSMAVFSMQLSE